MAAGSVLGCAAAAARGCAHDAGGHAFHPAVVAADTGIIYFYRVEAAAQAKAPRKQARALAVFIDDIPLGWFSRGGYVPFHVRPGEHFIKVLVAGHAHQTELRVEAFGEYFVRYDVSPSGPSLESGPERRRAGGDCRLSPVARRLRRARPDLTGRPQPPFATRPAAAISRSIPCGVASK